MFIHKCKDTRPSSLSNFIHSCWVKFIVMVTEKKPLYHFLQQESLWRKKGERKADLRCDLKQNKIVAPIFSGEKKCVNAVELTRRSAPS